MEGGWASMFLNVLKINGGHGKLDGLEAAPQLIFTGPILCGANIFAAIREWCSNVPNGFAP
jgi:hypothetical protein